MSFFLAFAGIAGGTSVSDSMFASRFSQDDRAAQKDAVPARCPFLSSSADPPRTNERGSVDSSTPPRQVGYASRARQGCPLDWTDAAEGASGEDSVCRRVRLLLSAPHSPPSTTSIRVPPMCPASAVFGGT